MLARSTRTVNHPSLPLCTPVPPYPIQSILNPTLVILHSCRHVQPSLPPHAPYAPARAPYLRHMPSTTHPAVQNRSRAPYPTSQRPHTPPYIHASSAAAAAAAAFACLLAFLFVRVSSRTSSDAAAAFSKRPPFSYVTLRLWRASERPRGG